MAPDFRGPEALAAKILESRREIKLPGCIGNISDENVVRLITIAYYAGQRPNEGHFPHLRLLSPAPSEDAKPIFSFDQELNPDTLYRIAPTIASRDHAILINEREGKLRMAGTLSLRGFLNEWGAFGQTMIPKGD